MQNILHKNKWPLVIFLAAFFIRLIYLIQSQSNPAFYTPMVDELWHLNWARDIISGSFWGDGAYFRAPLYPYLLAFFVKITGDSIFWIRFLQILIASGSAVLVYLLGNKLFSQKIGIIAGLGYSIYGTLIAYETMLLIPVLFVFLNLLAVYLLIYFKDSPVWRHWLVAGMVLGLSAISRPNILLLTPLFLIWIYIIADNSNTKRRIFPALIYLVGLLLPVLSVSARNLVVTGEFILISSQGGVNLYIGNNPETEGLTMLMPEIDLDESLPWTEFTKATRAAAESEAGRPLSDTEESSFWKSKAVDFIISNPGRFISITFKKCIYFVLGFENSDQTDLYFARKFSSLYSVLLWNRLVYFPFGMLLPLAIIGMIASWKHRHKQGLVLIYLFILCYIPTVVLFLVTARHRLPVIPFMLLFAAAGIIYLINLIREKNHRKFTGMIALFLIVLILCNRTYFDIGFSNVSQTHFNLALTYDRQGNLEMAETEYMTAVRENPNSATTLNNLGYVQYRLGKYNDAMNQFSNAIKIDPEFADPYNNIGLVYEAGGDFANAEKFYRRALEIDSDLYQAYLNLGDLFKVQNDLNQAESMYIKARDINPENKIAFTKLAVIYAQRQEFAKAEEMFTAAEKKGELSAIDLVNWGNIYYSSSQPSRALEYYRHSINKNTEFARGYFNMALVFYRFGYPVDSTRKYLNEALRIDPSFEAARNLFNEINK